MSNINILIVEDEFIIAEDTSETLVELGYTVIGNVRNYADAIAILKENTVHIALIDINLNDEKNGINVASEIKNTYHIPFIFVTSYADKATVEQAKNLKPNGYLLKPFDKKDLYTSIEIALSNFTSNSSVSAVDKKDFLFIKDGTSLVKLKFTDILFLKSEANYVAIKTEQKTYLIRKTLKDLSHELPSDIFMQVHKSFVINTTYISLLQANTVNIKATEIPIGREFKEELLKRII